MIKKWIFENLVWIFSIISFVIAICCIWIIGTDISDIFCLSLKDKSNLLRNILLGLGALIAVPFLVWQNTTSHKALHETKENNKNTQRNNDKTQEAKMYIDCITQLANEKETIRTAAIHGLHELIKNTKDDSLKEKIFNILWSFMVEHSKKCIKINDGIQNYGKIKYPTEEHKTILEDLEKELKPEKENIEKFYSQFKIILEILAKYKDKTHTQWWKDKSMRNIRLHGINLIHAVLKNAELNSANLQNVDLRYTQLQEANLKGATLWDVDLQGTQLQKSNLQGVKLSYLITPFFVHVFMGKHSILEDKSQGIDSKNSNDRLWILPNKLQDIQLEGAKYNSKPWTDPDTKEIYEPTQFPEKFDPKAHGMIDVSEEKS